MKPEELKEYLGIVVDMEKNIFMQGQTMSQWEREIVGLGKAHEFQMPSKPEEKPLPEWVNATSGVAPPQPTPLEQPKIIRYLKRALWIAVVICVISNICVSFLSVSLALELLVAAPIANRLISVIAEAIVCFNYGGIQDAA